MMSCVCSFDSDNGDQNRVFSSAASRVVSYEILISIIRSSDSNERPAASAPSCTDGTSWSSYSSLPLPDVQMNPSPARPAYFAKNGRAHVCTTVNNTQLVSRLLL